ncbi:MAG: Triheme cytochrome c [Nitrospinae bacterium CG11_big_fil_rev_8_21_14_0_20_56_8]|nr:MAG: Triheme cytochrome c [Nitrospinae bacterium CG11_big_fil_rev_8_21_14_0_20_56_8]
MNKGLLFFLPILFLVSSRLASPALAQEVHFHSPPASEMPQGISVEKQTFSLKNLRNPFTRAAKSPEKALQEGATVYFKHCVFCHGDLLDGSGVFGDRFFPKPASFIHEGSFINKPEGYGFWRVLKGGKGLPKPYSPWNSAMPAWEGQLTVDEVWKVLLFIQTTARERLADKANTPSEPSEDLGKKIYQDKCVHCHGATGEGDGVITPFSSPRPRDLSKGHIKLRTTPFGKVPTDDDLFLAITHGMKGTTMPPWGHLSETERWGLVAYIKTLSPKFEKFEKKNKSHTIITVPEPPPLTLESIARGKDLFIKNCSGCHGVKGRNDGVSTRKIVNIPTDALWPRNLSKPWTFRRGVSRKQIYLTLRTGLSGTAMPRFSERVFNDAKVWDIVHYVQTLSLSQKPEVSRQIRIRRTDGTLPENPEDPVWKTVPSYFFPVGGQIMYSEKSFFPTTDNVYLKALHNGDEIAFLVEWDDPKMDPFLSNLIPVKESPPPPLPPELQVDEGEPQVESHPKPQKFSDSVALQFPAAEEQNGDLPNFLNGDADHPVNLWKWDSYPFAATELNARGLQNWNEQDKPSQNLKFKASYEYGRYSVVFVRKLKTPDTRQDVQFASGAKVPVAVNVWNGSEGETGTRKAVSSWFEALLE